MLNIFRPKKRSSLSFMSASIDYSKIGYHEVCLMIEEGASVSEVDSNKATPLHKFIVANADISIINKLIESGAKVNAQDLWGCTPLHMAAHFHQDEKVAKLLLDHHANVNHVEKEHGLNAIQHACWNSNEKVMEIIINYGGKVYGDLNYNLSLSGLANNNPNPKVGQILIEHSLKQMFKSRK